LQTSGHTQADVARLAAVLLARVDADPAPEGKA